MVCVRVLMERSWMIFWACIVIKVSVVFTNCNFIVTFKNIQMQSF